MAAAEFQAGSGQRGRHAHHAAAPQAAGTERDAGMLTRRSVASPDAHPDEARQKAVGLNPNAADARHYPLETLATIPERRMNATDEAPDAATAVQNDDSSATCDQAMVHVLTL